MHACLVSLSHIISHQSIILSDFNNRKANIQWLCKFSGYFLTSSGSFVNFDIVWIPNTLVSYPDVGRDGDWNVVINSKR
jgi:hypothetical protein